MHATDCSASAPSIADEPVRSCVICGETNLHPFTRHYLECRACGHQQLAEGQHQQIIVNSILDEAAHRTANYQVHKQVALALACTQSRDLLIDVGCASGKFLLHAGERFARAQGIEISDPSRDFASRVLGLDIVGELPTEGGPPSLVTFWQSMEHIPARDIGTILDRIYRRSDAGSRVLVSVPNGQSLQSRIYRGRFAYFDVPNHLHQFSVRSLDILMSHHGFKPCQVFVAPIYQAFGHVQSLLNLVFPIHDYLYYRLQRGHGFNLPAGLRRGYDLLNMALGMLLSPVAAILTLIDIAVPGERGVVTKCYKKK